MHEIKTFYNNNGDKRVFKVDQKLLGIGSCGFVRRCSNGVLLKEYFDSRPNYFKLKLDIYKVIQTIANKHVMRIYDFLYKDEPKFEMNENADAYTCQHINEPTIDSVLRVSSQYILENIYELISLVSIFTEKQVRLEDLKIENVILTENNMVLIDPDFWKLSPLSYQLLRAYNIRRMLVLFKLMCAKAIESNIQYFSDKDLYFYYDIVDQLFQISEKQIEDNEDITQIINQRLKGYKYPIDYIKTHAKK